MITAFLAANWWWIAIAALVLFLGKDQLAALKAKLFPSDGKTELTIGDFDLAGVVSKLITVLSNAKSDIALSTPLRGVVLMLLAVVQKLATNLPADQQQQATEAIKVLSGIFVIAPDNKLIPPTPPTPTAL